MTDDLHKRAFCECPRCGQLEQYGCGCTMIEMLDWHRDDRAALLARLEAVEKERDDLAKEVDGIENLWRFWSDKAREAVGRCGDYRRRAEAAEAALTAARAALVTARNEALEWAMQVYRDVACDADTAESIINDAIRALPVPTAAELTARIKESDNG